MSATATVTKTVTTAQLTAVALHTLDASHASVSVSWVTNRFTTYFGQYVVGETDAAGNFRTDRPIETWSANAFAQKFFEPGATGTSADRLVCESQVGATLLPRPTTTLGYGVQECAQVHINPSNSFFTTTGSTTITPQPISTFRNAIVTTSTMYKDSFKEAGNTIENIIKTRIIIGVVVAVVVALLGALVTYLRRRKSTKGYMFKKPKGHVHTTSDSVEEGKLQPDNSQIFYPPQQPYQPGPQGYPVPPGPPPPQGYYGAPPPPPPPGGYYVPPPGGPPPPGQQWQPPPAFNP